MTPLHIPDPELHAYLDQALPRSRCVTIESHLAACPGCRARRDATAALRDRTTQLLARLTPERRRIPPSFEELERRAAARRTVPRLRPRDVAWAASILLAVALGYGLRPGARAARQSSAERVVPVPTAVAAAPQAMADRSAESAGVTATGPRRASAPTRPVRRAPDTARPVAPPAPALGETPAPVALEVSTDSLPPETAPTAGLWRTVPWTEAETQSGSSPPRVDGVPVVEVQVKRGEDASKPVTVVAQQLKSGQLITTIAGPVDDVWALLSKRGDTDTAGAETVRQGSRLLAVSGNLPADSLRAMVRRVNAAMRVR